MCDKRGAKRCSHSTRTLVRPHHFVFRLGTPTRRGERYKREEDTRQKKAKHSTLIIPTTTPLRKWHSTTNAFWTSWMRMQFPTRVCKCSSVHLCSRFSCFRHFCMLKFSNCYDAKSKHFQVFHQVGIHWLLSNIFVVAKKNLLCVLFSSFPIFFSLYITFSPCSSLN